MTTPHPTRFPSLTAAALAAAVLLLAAAPAPASEAPSLPEGVLPAAVFPGFDLAAAGPADTQATLRALQSWLARHPADARRPGLEGAALEARRSRLGEKIEAADWREVAARYPAGAPYAALAWLRAAEASLGAITRADLRITALERALHGLGAEGEHGRTVAADLAGARIARATAATEGLESLERARAAARAGPPVDAAEGIAARWAEVTAAMPIADRHEARLLAALDRPAEAAERFEALAEEAGHGEHAHRSAAHLWEQAARQRRLAGDKDRARAAIGRALDVVEDRQHEVWLAMWRLYNEHDLLDAHADVAGVTGWPGEAFVEDVHAMLRGLQGNPYVGKSLLTLGSTALANDRPAVALDFYLLALNDPSLIAEADLDPTIARGLLSAVPAALGLGRYEDAERLFDTFGHTLSEKAQKGMRGQIEALRALAEERAGLAAGGPEPVDTPPDAARPDEAPPERRPAGRLAPVEPSPSARKDAPGAAAAEPGASPWPWLALGLAPFLVLLVLARRRR